MKTQLMEETAKPVDAAAIKQKQMEQAAEESLQNIYFDFDSFLLDQTARNTLTNIGAFLRSYPQTTIKIEGHCDERGSSEYNMALGQKRADEAQKYLIGLGISPDRIETVSWGEERPADTGENEQAWSRNRRDEFTYNAQ